MVHQMTEMNSLWLKEVQNFNICFIQARVDSSPNPSSSVFCTSLNDNPSEHDGTTAATTAATQQPHLPHIRLTMPSTNRTRDAELMDADRVEDLKDPDSWANDNLIYDDPQHKDFALSR